MAEDEEGSIYIYLLNMAEGKEDHKRKGKESYQSAPPNKSKKMIKELHFLISKKRDSSKKFDKIK